jgi:nucleosome binding factor SPN SPT16 subunit
MTDIYKNITDLKKEAAKKEAERKEMEDIVEQDKLIEIKGRRPFRLGDVFARPQMDGKRLPGELEIHHNGLRYHSTIRSDNRIGKYDHLPHTLVYSSLTPTFKY